MTLGYRERERPAFGADPNSRVAAGRHRYAVPIRLHTGYRERRRGPAAVIVLAAVVLAAVGVASKVSRRDSAGAPQVRLYTLELGGLREATRRIDRGDASARRALSMLIEQADRAENHDYPTVMAKTALPPSGDRHDYYSLSDYYWPDSTKADGLPYIRQDGRRNPEVDTITDRRYLKDMIRAVSTLALAYYFTGTRSYATKVATVTRDWLLSPATRMDPNLRFAQIVRGGRAEGQGIIDTNELPRMIDAISLVAPAGVFDSGELVAVRLWFGRYLQWLVTSAQGHVESSFGNNRETWYRAQVVAVAGFVGDDVVAHFEAQAGRALIAKQITSLGEQPAEIARSNSWDYSALNVTALLRYAIAAEAVGVDLFHYRSQGGGSIEGALLCLTPYVVGDRSWPGHQMNEFDRSALSAALAYGEYEYSSSSPALRQARAMAPSEPDLDLAFPSGP